MVILQIVPGTHDWNKFITPEEVRRVLLENGMGVSKLSGIVPKVVHAVKRKKNRGTKTAI